MDVDTGNRFTQQTKKPLQIQQDVLDHLGICEDAITQAAREAADGKPLTTETAKKLAMLSNTRVTSGLKLGDTQPA